MAGEAVSDGGCCASTAGASFIDCRPVSGRQGAEAVDKLVILKNPALRKKAIARTKAILLPLTGLTVV
jgi:hypothetical protein